MRKKLRSQRGDTLVETLAALLIVVLAVKPTGLFSENLTEKV